MPKDTRVSFTITFTYSRQFTHDEHQAISEALFQTMTSDVYEAATEMEERFDIDRVDAEIR